MLSVSSDFVIMQKLLEEKVTEAEEEVRQAKRAHLGLASEFGLAARDLAGLMSQGRTEFESERARLLQECAFMKERLLASEATVASLAGRFGSHQGWPHPPPPMYATPPPQAPQPTGTPPPSAAAPVSAPPPPSFPARFMEKKEAEL